MDVLRHVCEGLVPGGCVVDLQAIEPSGRVEVDGLLVGEIDDGRFFARARQAVAGLDRLVVDGLLEAGAHTTVDTFVRFDSGAELIANITDASERDLPPALAARLAGAGPCAIRERSLVRVFRRV